MVQFFGATNVGLFLRAAGFGSGMRAHGDGYSWPRDLMGPMQSIGIHPKMILGLGVDSHRHHPFDADDVVSKGVRTRTVRRGACRGLAGRFELVGV
jgi:hypothetical protein